GPVGCTLFCSFSCCGDLHARYVHSFPTRRSSDLLSGILSNVPVGNTISIKVTDQTKGENAYSYQAIHAVPFSLVSQTSKQLDSLDRKSTRLNSSHVKISYAVFCLKKKTQTHGTAC